MGRRETLIEQLEPLLEPGEPISHAFVANFGEAKPSPVAMLVIAVTDRNIVSAGVSHTVKWKVSEDEVARWPRVPFPDVPGGSLPGGKRWSWNGLDLWLDRPGRKEATDANETLVWT